MIKKWIENTEEIRQRLTQMLMDDTREMCRYERDIYMYIDEDGRARLEWFSNFDGDSWIDDDHYLLYVCMQHYDDIEDDATDYEDQADKIMRSFCRKSIDDAQRIEDITDTVPIVWLFVIDADDQRAKDKQRGFVMAMTKEEYRKYLTERIAETEKVIIALSDAQDAGYTGRDTGVLALLLAAQLDHLKHDLYYLNNEGGDSNG